MTKGFPLSRVSKLWKYIVGYCKEPHCINSYFHSDNCRILFTFNLVEQSINLFILITIFHFHYIQETRKTIIREYTLWHNLQLHLDCNVTFSCQTTIKNLKIDAILLRLHDVYTTRYLTLIQTNLCFTDRFMMEHGHHINNTSLRIYSTEVEKINIHLKCNYNIGIVIYVYSQILGILLHQVGKFQQQPAASTGIHCSPYWSQLKRLLCRGNSFLYVSLNSGGRFSATDLTQKQSRAQKIHVNILI